MDRIKGVCPLEHIFLFDQLLRTFGPYASKQVTKRLHIPLANTLRFASRQKGLLIQNGTNVLEEVIPTNLESLLHDDACFFDEQGLICILFVVDQVGERINCAAHWDSGIVE